MGRQMLLKDKSHVELETRSIFSFGLESQGEALTLARIPPTIREFCSFYISGNLEAGACESADGQDITGEHPLRLENAASGPVGGAGFDLTNRN